MTSRAIRAYVGSRPENALTLVAHASAEDCLPRVVVDPLEPVPQEMPTGTNGDLTTDGDVPIIPAYPDEGVPACGKRTMSSPASRSPKVIPIRSATASPMRFSTRFLTEDPQSRVAVETLCTTNFIVLAGEVRGPDSMTHDRLKDIARHAVRDIGYEQRGFHWKDAEIISHIHSQSTDIARGRRRRRQQGRRRRRSGHHVRLRLPRNTTC